MCARTYGDFQTFLNDELKSFHRKTEFKSFVTYGEEIIIIIIKYYHYRQECRSRGVVDKHLLHHRFSMLTVIMIKTQVIDTYTRRDNDKAKIGSVQLWMQLVSLYSTHNHRIGSKLNSPGFAEKFIWRHEGKLRFALPLFTWHPSSNTGTYMTRKNLAKNTGESTYEHN
jgi:hypothetical protein